MIDAVGPTRRERLIASPYVMLSFAWLGCAAAALLVPFVWAADLYVDGYRIANTPPALEVMGGSYAAASFLLQPWLAVWSAAGADPSEYGVVLGFNFYLANYLFGATFLLGVTWLMVRRGSALRGFPVAVTLILLTPFSFNITKELVLFLVSVAALSWGAASADRRGTLTIMTLSSIGLGLCFRSYYLLFALILLVNVTAWRRYVRLPVYSLLAVVIVLLYEHLPTDEVATGRAYYLEDVSQTRISYLLPDAGGANFVANRVIALVELLLPLRLILLSPVYLPYVVLQLVLTWRTAQALSGRYGSVTKQAAHVVLAFTITQAVFEPDFGSYFRHKLGILPFLLVVLSGVRPRQVLDNFQHGRTTDRVYA